MDRSELSQSTRRWFWAGAGLLLLVSLAALVVPLMILQPFSPQTPGSIGIAYTIRRAAPLGGAVVALGVLLLAARLWPGAGRGRAGLVLLGVLALAVAGLVWVNPFERMFAPLPQPGFASAAAASWVAPPDLVLALSESPGPRGGHCFPLRQIAYHHVVNLEVDGRPLVVTY